MAAKKATKIRPWTKEDVRTPQDARARRNTEVIAHKLKRTLGATYQRAQRLGGEDGERAREASSSLSER
jgi:hypothetical protein